MAQRRQRKTCGRAGEKKVTRYTCGEIKEAGGRRALEPSHRSAVEATPSIAARRSGIRRPPGGQRGTIGTAPAGARATAWEALLGGLQTAERWPAT